MELLVKEDDAKSTDSNHFVSKRAEGASSMKLPKLSIPRFDGNILNRRTFWEQFGVSIHNRPQLSDAEKLAYLKDTMKDVPAERVIQGLAQTGDSYDDAIECLLNRYDQPRLIHQAHVRAILDDPSLKEGNGK